MNKKPSITVITVVFNAKSLIEATINSVLQQTYTSVEYIIIDGASTDGTLQLIDPYRTKLAFFVSEKDKGIYDAMNKGLEKATGDYVLFMNAGDLLYEPTTLEKIFADTRYADVYYGNTKIIDLQGNIVGDKRQKPPSTLNWKSLKYGMCVSHQSFIAKRSLCDPYGLNYKLSADIDWVIRILKKATLIVNTNLTISKYLQGGASVKRRHLSIMERYTIMVKHYGFFPTFFYHAYIVFRLLFQVVSGKRKSMD